MSNVIERARAWLESVPPTVRSDAPDTASIIRDLLAIVELLPVTADGVPVVPGMELFGTHIGDSAMFGVWADTKAYWVQNHGDDEGRHWTGLVEDFYSTRQAAEEARKAND